MPDGDRRVVAGPSEGGAPDRSAVDPTGLSRRRRDRCVAALAAGGLDAVVVGREANVRYISGADRLWTSGTRPYGPTCVLLADGQVHLVSTLDAGVPEGIPFDHLIGLSWSPERLGSALAGIDGLHTAARVGVDGMSVAAEALLRRAAPRAEVVDATALLGDVRQVKIPEELYCLGFATALARRAALATGAEARPGAPGRRLAATFVAVLSGLADAQACGGGLFGPWSGGSAGFGPVAGDGDLVVVDGGALWHGYQGDAVLTVPCGDPAGSVGARHRSLAGRADDILATIREECRAGVTGCELVATARRAGARTELVPVVRGLGLGVEQPVVGGGLPETAAGRRPLPAGAVIGVRAGVGDDRGLALAGETVVLTDAGCDPVLGPETLRERPGG